MSFLTSKTFSKIGADMRTSVRYLEDRITEQQMILRLTEERQQRTDAQMKLTQAADHKMLELINDKIDRVGLSVVEASHFGRQVMNFLNGFTGKVHELLRAILFSNLELYRLMIQQQQNMPARPTNSLESNIKFEDALGEIKELPYVHFRQWEVKLQAVLLSLTMC